MYGLTDWLCACSGGGYAYRMAPLDSPLDEAAFRKMPLDFVGNSILRWGGDTATQLEFSPAAKGWETSEGTVPAGSMWRKVSKICSDQQSRRLKISQTPLIRLSAQPQPLEPNTTRRLDSGRANV